MPRSPGGDPDSPAAGQGEGFGQNPGNLPGLIDFWPSLHDGLGGTRPRFDVF
jgi:hypothetical protein